MSQIIKKGIANDSVDDLKIRLRNNQFMRARNAADSADVSLFKLNSSDAMEFFAFPQKSGSPANANDLVNKSYVDGLLSGVAWKEPVRLATTGNITLSGNQTIDGVTTVNGDRVLVKNQSTGSENGIYIADAGSWVRSSDANASSELDSAAVFVKEGTANANKGFVQTADSVNLGVTALVFVQFSDTTTAVPVSGKETFTLDGTNITNQYLDLAQVAETGSVLVMIKGLGPVLEGVSQQYSISYTGGVGGKSRISFLNEIAIGGVSELIAGDIVQIMYRY